MWTLKVILVSACWAGISSQPHESLSPFRPRRDVAQGDLTSLVQTQNNIFKMLQDTKTMLQSFRDEFLEYKSQEDKNEEIVTNLLNLTKIKEDDIQSLKTRLDGMTTSIQEQEGRLRLLEEENRELTSSRTQKDLQLVHAQEQLQTLRRTTQWDCAQLLLQGHRESGVYRIYPRKSNESVQVWCDMKTEGGGWTVFLNRARQEVQLNFSVPWQAYADGFGNPAEEYWLGNKHLHALTRGSSYILRIDAQNLEGEKRFGKWMHFSIGDENSKFKIRISDYSTTSTLGDVLTEEDQNGEKYNPNGMKFSTMDQDNDRREGKSCSQIFGSGGWWYNNCYRLNPTAPLGDRNGDNTKARLYYWGPDIYTVQGVQALQLKIRKR